MKKILQSFSILLFSLTFNACVQKDIYTNSNEQLIPITPTYTHTRAQIPSEYQMPTQTEMQTNTTEYQVPTQTETRVDVIAPSTAGNLHHLRTVQGATLTVQERSNGFVFPQYQNKIVLLEIFGKDCHYCFDEMPIINRLKQKYSGDLQIIAVQAQDAMSKQTSSRVIQQFQMDYPVVDKDEGRDLLYFLQTTYGWTGVLPYILIIKNGVTEYSVAGEVSYQELEEDIQSLL